MTSPFFPPAPKTLGEKIGSAVTTVAVPASTSTAPIESGPTRALARAQRLAVGEKPENARRVLDLSARTGYSADFVRENLDALEAEASTATFDPATFARTSPIAAEWLAANPTRTVLLGKDFRTLSTWERQARHVAAQFRSGMAQNELLRIGEAVLSGTATPAQRARQAALEGAIAETPDFGVEGFFEGAAGAAAGQLPILGRTLKAAGIGGTIGAAVGATAGAVATKTPAGTVAAMRFGLSFGAAANAAAESGIMEASGAMLDYERIEGMDPETARGAALIVGAINGALETLSLGELSKLVPGVREAIRPSIRSLLAGPTTRGVLRAYAQQVAKATATEGMTEGMQSLITQWSGTIADAAQSGRLQTDLLGVIRDTAGNPETWTQAASEARVGAQSAMFLGTAGAATTMGRDVRRAMTAERSARALEVVAASVGESTVTEEAPKEAAALLTELHQSGLDAVTYTVGDWTELWQGVTDETGAPIDPAAVAREVLGTEVSQYEQAAAVGPEAVFRVPMGTWATRLARNPAVRMLAVDFARTTPDAMNRREAQAQTESMDAVLTELMDTIVSAKQEAKPVEEMAASLAERVESEVRKAGRPAPEARAAGEVWSRVYRAFAASSGSSAEDVLAAFNRVRTTSPKAEAAAARERAELAAYVTDDARYVAATPEETAAYPGARDVALDAEAQAAEDAAAAEAQALGRVKPATTVKGAVKTVLTRATDESLVATYIEMRDRVSEAEGQVVSLDGDAEFRRAVELAGVGRWEEAQGAYENATGAAGQWSFREAYRDYQAAQALVAKQTPGMQRLAAEMQRRGLDPDAVTSAAEFNAAMFDQRTIPADVWKDESGNPVVVYHGSPKKGLTDMAENARGVFFSDSPELAEQYTAQRGPWMGSRTGHVYPAMLRMTNPLIIDALGKRNDNIPVPWQEWKQKVFGNLPANAVSVEDALARAVADGHDGLIVRNVVDTVTTDDRTKSTVYAVPRADQVVLRESDSLNQRAIPPSDAEVEVAAMVARQRALIAKTREYLVRTGRMAADEMPIEVGDTLDQPAYHGTPHIFDRFTTAKMGTGEGAQAYGWGLYFAENPDIGEGYRRSLAGNELRVNGVTVEQDRSVRAVREAFSYLDYIRQANPSQDNEWVFWQARKEARKLERDDPAALAAILKQLDEWEGAGAEVVQSGALYRVDIRDEAVATFLDWDKPLEKQSAAVKKALSDAGWTPKVIKATLGDYRNGEHIYHLISGTGGYTAMARADLVQDGPEAGSKYLASIGIRGIKFLDAGSRSQGDGTRNLVVFDENDITITHRNGEPVTAAERADALNQDTDAPRGRIVFTPGRFAARIDLLQKADPSTFLHESAHFFFTLMGQLASAPNASEAIRNDYRTAVEWAGGTVDTPLTVEQEERLARGFEAYLMEGKAPSLDLRRVFQQFAAWLTRVYRDLTRLNVTLTPEVRDVFDRMLATEDAIREAEAAQERAPLIPDAQAVMTAPDAERYLVAQAEARAAAEEQVRADVMAVITREEKDWWKAQKAAMREEVEAEVFANPAYIARAVLTTGKMPDGTPLDPSNPLLARIDKAGLVALIGEDGVKALPKGVTRAKGGLPADAVAAALGFVNATDLVTALQSTEAQKAHIERVTQERMVAEHGDPMTDGTLPDRAMVAIHQRQRDRVVRLELEHMARENPAALKAALRRLGGRLPTTEAVTLRAEAMVASRKLRDIRPIEWQRSEVAAAKAAIAAAMDGKWEVAFEAKLREQLSLALYRASVDAHEEVAKGRSQFARVFQSDAKLGKTRDLNYVNAARALLATVGIGRAGKTATEYLAAIETYDPEQAAMFREMLSVVVAPVADSRDLTLDEFRIVTTQVNALWTEARETKRITVDGRRVDREDAINALSVAAEGVRSRLAGAGVTRPWELKDDALKTLLSARALLTRVEFFVDFMDVNDPARSWRKVIFEGIREATTAKTIATRGYFEQFDALLKTMGPMGTARIPARELGPAWQWKSHAHLLGALLHTGNASNFDKMLRGRGWDRGQWDAMIRRFQQEGVLTKAHYDAIQGIWDVFEAMKPEAQRVHKAMMGYYFEEVTAEPVVTPWGTYRGGYTPATRDSDAAADARNRQAVSEFENAHGFSLPAVGKGFTKGRTEAASPLLLDLKIVKQHIDAVQRFVHLAEPVRDLSRLFQDRAFVALAEEVDPRLVPDVLMPWLRRTSTQVVETPTNLGAIGKVIDATARHIRSTASMAYMTVNVQNALENYFSLAGLAKLRVPQRYLNQAIAAYIRQPVELPKLVGRLSPYMDTRMTAGVIDVQRSIDSMLVQPNALQEGSLWMREHAQFLQRFTQHQTETVTWWGAYLQALDAKESDAEAIRLADATTRMTMGGFEAIDVSRIETGPALWRTLAMFASWFNMVLNLNAGEVLKVQRVTGLKQGMPRLLYVYTFGIFAMVMGSAALRNVFRGEGLPDDEDDDGYLDEWFSWWAEEQFRFGAAMLPVAGNVLQVPVNAMDEKFYNDRLTLSPAINFLESALKGPAGAYAMLEGDPSRTDVRNLMQFLALMTGTPAGALAKPAGYLYDVQSGAAEPTGPVDFTRGLLSGRP